MSNGEQLSEKPVHVDNQAVRLNSFREDFKVWDYSPSVRIVDNALLMPQIIQGRNDELCTIARLPYLMFNGGVYDANGRIVEEALHQGAAGLRHVPDVDPSIEEVPRLPGKWLYGGMLYRHIGHMLTESVGRLWGLSKNDNSINGVVFIAYNGEYTPSCGKSEQDWASASAEYTSNVPHFIQLCKIFCPDIPVRVLGSSVRADHLVVPTQLMGLLPYRDLVGGHETFRQCVRDRVRDYLGDIKPNGSRLFISRSRFIKPSAASIFGEKALDQYFQDHGYQVIHPENLTLGEQLFRYAAASHIVLAAGSAAHVIALATNPSQHVALVRRYPGQTNIFKTQLQLMGAGSSSIVDAIDARFLPSSTEERDLFRQSAASGIYTIDLETMWSQLQRLGFVNSSLTKDSRTFTLEEEWEFRLQLKAQYGKEFTLRKL